MLTRKMFFGPKFFPSLMDGFVLLSMKRVSTSERGYLLGIYFFHLKFTSRALYLAVCQNTFAEYRRPVNAQFKTV